jgi:hypothetical protein
MKKIILLSFILILLSGCTANYEVVIDGDKIKERLTITETDKSIFDKITDTGWTVRDSFDALLSGDEFSRQDYSIKSLNSEDQLGVKYSNDSLESLENSSVINQCFNNPSISVEDNIVYIDTGEFECFDLYDNLDSIRIVFKTNHKVLDANADTIENDSYIWNITKDSNKVIKISYDSSITKINYTTYIVVVLIFIVLIIGLLLVFRKVKNKNNF